MYIKICGLTQVSETRLLGTLPVNLAGFVLYFPKSKRNITPTQAKELLAELPEGIQSVAVVVSPTRMQLQELQELGFDLIQIHGTFPWQDLDQIHVPLLRAIAAGNAEEWKEFQHCPQVKGFVFDAAEPGSGKTFDWSQLSEIPRGEKLLFLAGGLNPDNVTKAIAAVCPDGVDVSSGVEYTDGTPGKDPARVRAFVEAVVSASC